MEKLDKEKASSLKLQGSIVMRWNWPGGYLKHNGRKILLHTVYTTRHDESHPSLFLRRWRSAKAGRDPAMILLPSLPGKMFLHFSHARSCDRHSHLGFTKLRLKIWSHKLSNLSRNTGLPDALSFFTLSETLLHLALPCSVCLASPQVNSTLLGLILPEVCHWIKGSPEWLLSS